ncbi:MAG: M15 family metallopeptidase [Actinomycetota bacterium]
MSRRSSPPPGRRRRAAVRRRRTFAALVVLLVGATVFALTRGRTAQPPASAAGSSHTPSALGSSSSPASTAMPPAYLAWMPGGFPSSFRAQVGGLSGVKAAVVVAGDTLWMTKSLDANGAVVTQPAPPYEVPIYAFAVDPRAYATFLPDAYRERVTAALAAGKAVLGTTSAKLRGFGVGGRLVFGATSVTVGAVVPDAVAGWSELLVSRKTGADLGIVDDRYLLADMQDHPSDSAFLALIQPLLTPGVPVRVAAPGEVRYVRVASGSAPPVVLKAVFGEFSAYPDPSDPITLRIDPAWISAHLETKTVPLLGSETCNQAFFPALIGAMEQLQREGLGSLVKSNAGCYNPELLAATATAPPSFHAYGAAIDINAPENPFGSPPTQDRRLVKVMQHWGFNWGGDFLVPDGMHFEYLSPPPSG